MYYTYCRGVISGVTRFVTPYGHNSQASRITCDHKVSQSELIDGRSTNFSYSFKVWSCVLGNSLRNDNASCIQTCDWSRDRDPNCRAAVTVLESNILEIFDVSAWVARDGKDDGQITMITTAIHAD